MLALTLSVSQGAPVKSSAAKRRAGAKKATSGKPAATAPRPIPVRPANSALVGLVRAYRESPSPARRAAIQAYAASHPKERDLAKLALGITAWEQKEYPAAVEALQSIAARLPEIADYAGYYAAAAQLELAGSSDGVGEAIKAIRSTAVPSPYAGKAWILEARANAGDAVRILREHYRELPQPEGDLALAEAYQKGGDLAHAAEYFQRVYYWYAVGDGPTKSGAALVALRETMGSAYPSPTAEQMLRRGDRLLETRDYAAARTEFSQLASQLSGVDRDRALVRVGSTELWSGRPEAALRYLSGLKLAPSDAEAERLYFVVESARRVKDDDAMASAVNRLNHEFKKSSWRAKALVAAGNRYLLANEPDRYIPLYRALYEDFPADDQAPACHWKVAFNAHFRDDRSADGLLRDHVRSYPWHPSAASALYFLGRRAERAGEFAAAHAYYSRITETYPNQYYGVLARERLTQVKVAGAAGADKATQYLRTVAFPPRKAPVLEPTPATAARIARSRLLHSAGLNDLADSELRFGAKTDGQPPLLAMELASSADAVHTGLRTMKGMSPDYLNLPIETASRQFWELLYPLPWRADLVRNAQERNLDPYILAGLIRQESEFNPQALSHAKAYGLTQVRPPTGRMFARKVGLKRITNAMLFQPATNLKLGTAILRSMYDQNGGKWEQTLASYNAGPNRVIQWLQWNTYREPAEFVESIPITETREYVQAVLRNADLYRRLYEKQQPDSVVASR